MKEEKRVTSIARRMNGYWIRRTFLILVLSDAVLMGMIALKWIVVDNTAFWWVLGGAEFLLLILTAHGGRSNARKFMKPLEQMTQRAEVLSQARFDPEKLHHLEDALDTVSPLSPDAHVYTGDVETQSLVNAINNMLARTHESYMEQIRFVSDASHELRTPIAVIQGYADMLQRWGKEDATVLEEGITAIQSESAHMKKLIEQLLFLARGDSGRNQMVREDMDLSAMLKEVWEESQMIHPDRSWRLDAGEGIHVLGDAAMLKQCARILVENAVKYTAPDDRITLRAGIQDGNPYFQVQDNGIGIRQEDLEHIFDRFFRSDPARSRATGGTGLGLSIAKWIVEKHGGFFNVFSREEIGTRFTVTLPQEASAETDTRSVLRTAAV